MMLTTELFCIPRTVNTWWNHLIWTSSLQSDRIFAYLLYVLLCIFDNAALSVFWFGMSHFDHKMELRLIQTPVIPTSTNLNANGWITSCTNNRFIINILNWIYHLVLLFKWQLFKTTKQFSFSVQLVIHFSYVLAVKSLWKAQYVL